MLTPQLISCGWLGPAIFQTAGVFSRGESYTFTVHTSDDITNTLINTGTHMCQDSRAVNVSDKGQKGEWIVQRPSLKVSKDTNLKTASHPMWHVYGSSANPFFPRNISQDRPRKKATLGFKRTDVLENVLRPLENLQMWSLRCPGTPSVPAPCVGLISTNLTRAAGMGKKSHWR